jgi:acyl-CoA synthetase (AMP-forming)/AMP-acid ligase II
MKELVFSRTLVPGLQRNADAVGFIDTGSGRTVTFGEHLSRVSRLSGALSSELGVSATDKIAVLGLNSLPFMELWHASLLGAAVMNPLNMRFSADELAYVLSDSESAVCFVDATFAPLIASIRARTKLRHVVLIGDAADVESDFRYDDLVAAGKEQLPPEPDEESAAALMYTGGTTGMPKGVILSQRAEVLNQYHYAMEVPWITDQPAMVTTPMFHGASMLGIVGASMFGVPTAVIPSFEPEAWMTAVEKYDVGFSVLVPTMIAMVLNHPEFKPERLARFRRLVYGGSPMPGAVQTKLLAALPNTEVIQGYGMTECCAIATTFGNADHRSGNRKGSAGRPLPGVQFSIQDEAGTLLPTGEVGEVCSRGGNFLTEYLNKPEATAEALRDGWYHSGDVGYLDSAGYLFLVDRAKDMIISGGENVYSTEVENAIGTHPEILQVAIIGIPHDMWGETVHAVCVVKEGSTVTEADVIAHARTTIAGYKVPRSVEFRTEPLPMSAAMKVLKKDLRAPHWEGRESAIN